MKPTKPGDSSEEQSTNQTAASRTEQSMQGPTAATMRDVENVEQTATDAQKTAEDAKRLTVEETENLRQELEEVREEKEEMATLLEQCVATIRMLDHQLDRVEKATRGMGGYYESEDVADKAKLPSFEDLERVSLTDPEKNGTE